MAERITKYFMDIQDDGKDVYMRDTISSRVGNHNESGNDEALCLQLDLMDELRTTAEQRLARYQNRMVQHYNSRVRHRDFQV